MAKTILITGATDGIGFETAKILVRKGHHVLLHGRSPEKMQNVTEELSKIGRVESYIADLSDMNAVKSLVKDNGEPYVYLCGNSLGLQPKSTKEAIAQELEDWKQYGVEGHFHAKWNSSYYK